MKDLRLSKAKGSLSGRLSFPGDKSVTHRAIIFGSLAEGLSSFTNILTAEDCVCTRKAFQSLGVQIREEGERKLKIEGKGLYSLSKPQGAIDCGNSGTLMRLLLGVLAGQKFETILTGDPSLSSRPMRRVTDYLKKMGASVESKDGANTAPLKIHGGDLVGIDATLPIPSAQVKSAILLAGLYAKGRTSVTEPVKSRDHTERFLSYFGVPVKRKGLTVSLVGVGAHGRLPGRQADAPLQGRNFAIPGDISSAAFFIAAALLVPASKLHFKSILWNSTRSGILEVLKRMGVRPHAFRTREEGPESAADFSIQHQSIRSFEIKKEELPSLIDEIPILTVLATQAEGRSAIRDADELRVKETDRIHSMVANLSKMGAKLRAEGNTIFIEGPTPLHGAELDSFKDHRTAMALAVAALVAEGETLIRDVECINTSFPTFFDLLRQAGAEFR